MDGRTGVGGEATVGRAGRAQVSSRDNIAVRFEPIAMEAQQNFRIALQPSNLGPQRHRGSGREGRGKISADAVCAGVSATARHDMETFAAAEAAAGLPRGQVMRALWKPSAEAGLKIGIGDEIRAALRENLDIVHQTLTGALKENLERVGCAVAVVEHPGVFNVRPGAFVALVAIRPVGSEAVIAMRVNEFETAAAAISRFAPTPASAIGNLVHGDVNDVGDKKAAVGGYNLIRHREHDALASVGQASAVIAQGVVGVEAGVIGHEMRGVVGDNKVAPSRDDGVGRKSERDSIA